ncbi:MAG: hypothetical protein ACREQ7_05475 [Candidatus Binatia bacterium]
MIKFHGLGGEIGISKEQIQSIQKDGETVRPSLSLTEAKPTPRNSVREPTTLSKEVSPPVATEKDSATEEKLAERRTKEEKDYQNRIKEITEQIKQLRDRYSASTRGNTGPDPAFFTTEEAFRGHQEDLLSRLRDAQYKAQGLQTGRDAQSPPFSLSPPPPYSEKQKELSDLRTQMNQLETDRERLIEEMRQKNFDTGSLFLE